MPTPEPPCPGSLRVLVHRAQGLSTGTTGFTPDPQVNLRVLVSAPMHDTYAQENTQVRVGTPDPDFSEEFTIQVPREGREVDCGPWVCVTEYSSSSLSPLPFLVYLLRILPRKRRFWMHILLIWRCQSGTQRADARGSKAVRDSWGSAF